MKKYLNLFCTIVILFSFLFSPQCVNAETHRSFDIISISKDGYSVRLSIHYFNNELKDDDDTTYVGKILKNYRLFSSIKYKDKFVKNENVKWVNPEYIIVEGEQTVQLLFYCIDTKEEVVCDVYILGIKPKENTKEKIKKKSQEYTCTWEENKGSKIFDITPDMIGKDLVKSYDALIKHYISNGIFGEITFEDADKLQFGYNEVKWTFTPDDKDAKVFTGRIKFNVFEFNNDNVAEPQPQTTLTASNIILSVQSTYDINVLNKEENSTFTYSSSNPSIAKVNPNNGIVKGLAEGQAIITCEVTTPTESYSLTSNVTVVDDDNENYPVLSDVELDLEVGDKFTLEAENYTKGSKIRFSSSNKEVVKTSTKGKLTAIAKGTAIVKCTITNKDTVIVLQCKVVVE